MFSPSLSGFPLFMEARSAHVKFRSRAGTVSSISVVSYSSALFFFTKATFIIRRDNDLLMDH